MNILNVGTDKIQFHILALQVLDTLYAERDLAKIAKEDNYCDNCPLNASCFDYDTNLWHPKGCEDIHKWTGEEVYLQTTTCNFCACHARKINTQKWSF